MPRTCLLPLLLAMLTGIPSGCAAETAPVPSPEENQLFPLDTNLPGDPPASGRRYWTEPFKPLTAQGCYVSVSIAGSGKDRRYSVWQNTWGEEGA
jgi:hypothetical protein